MSKRYAAASLILIAACHGADHADHEVAAPEAPGGEHSQATKTKHVDELRWRGGARSRQPTPSLGLPETAARDRAERMLVRSMELTLPQG